MPCLLVHIHLKRHTYIIMDVLRYQSHSLSFLKTYNQRIC